MGSAAVGGKETVISYCDSSYRFKLLNVRTSTEHVDILFWGTRSSEVVVLMLFYDKKKIDFRPITNISRPIGWETLISIIGN